MDSKLSPFENAYAFTQKWEGGVSDRATDPGKLTKWGVTAATYADWRAFKKLPLRSVLDMDEVECSALYRLLFWDRTGCEILTARLGVVHFDTCVNCGPGRGWKFLAYCGHGSEENQILAYLWLRQNHYRQCEQNNPALAAYYKGWMNRLHSLEEYVGVSPVKA